jgi:hypothetical protein
MRVFPGQSLPIKARSYIEVDIPNEIQNASSTGIVDYSYTEGIEDAKRVITLKSAKTVKFDKVFEPSNSLKTEYALDMFSLYIGDLITPRTTEPTSSFKIRIYSEDGYL